MDVLLRLPQTDEKQAEALKAALSPDDWRGGCSTILTNRSGTLVMVEAASSCRAKVAKVRSLIDDVLRLVDALTYINEKLK